MRPLHTPKLMSIYSPNISSQIPGENTPVGPSLSTLIYLKGIAKFLKCRVLLPIDKPIRTGSEEERSRWPVAGHLTKYFNDEEKLNLHAEHGVDPGAWGLGRRLSAFKRRKRCLLDDWRRSHRLVPGRLICGGRRSRSEERRVGKECRSRWS